MTNKTIASASLLALGLLFSSIAGFNFNLTDGFHFHNFWVRTPLPLVDIATKNSSDLHLNSHLIGYLFYLVFGMISFGETDWSNWRNSMGFIAFVALVGLVIISDFNSFYQEITHQFTGRHIRMGLLVFLIGLSVFYRNKRFKNGNMYSETV